MGERRKSREIALQLLFQAELNPGHEPSIVLSVAQDPIDSTSNHRAHELFSSIWLHRESIDQKIEEVSENWKLGRMGSIDRNVLRLATYELLYCEDVPVEVVLDEAIEIAKRFGTEDSGSFVNGVLDQIGKRNPRRKIA